MSLAEPISSMIIFWDAKLELKCKFLPSRPSSLGTLLHPFKTRRPCFQYISVTFFVVDAFFTVCATPTALLFGEESSAGTWIVVWHLLGIVAFFLLRGWNKGRKKRVKASTYLPCNVLKIPVSSRFRLAAFHLRSGACL